MLVKKIKKCLYAVFEHLIDIELPNIRWESRPDIFEYNKTQPFLFKFMSPILNIGFSQNFPTWQLAKINLTQVGKYFVYEREKIIYFSRLSEKTTGKLFSYEQPLRSWSLLSIIPEVSTWTLSPPFIFSKMFVILLTYFIVLTLLVKSLLLVYLIIALSFFFITGVRWLLCLLLSRQSIQSPRTITFLLLFSGFLLGLCVGRSFSGLPLIPSVLEIMIFWTL